jgi:hypothetical protein
MPGKQTPFELNELLEQLPEVARMIDACVNDAPDLLKPALTNIARGIRQLEDARHIKGILEARDA